jgi:hypothetical protein
VRIELLMARTRARVAVTSGPVLVGIDRLKTNGIELGFLLEPRLSEHGRPRLGTQPRAVPVKPKPVGLHRGDNLFCQGFAWIL